MRPRHFGWILVFASSAAFAQQTWQSAYDQGLSSLKEKKFAEARAHFLAAIQLRPDDVADKTLLPGSPGGEASYWRNGALYSPNFAAAYAGYRLGTTTTDESLKTNSLRAAAGEFADLISKGQASAEATYFLSTTLSTLRDASLMTQFKSQLSTARSSWRVDADLLTPEDQAAIAGTRTTSVVVSTPIIQPTPAGERVESTGTATAVATQGSEPAMPVSTGPAKKPAKAPKKDTKKEVKGGAENRQQSQTAPATTTAVEPQQNPTVEPAPKKKDEPKKKKDEPKKADTPVANPMQENPTGEPTGTRKPKPPKKPNANGSGPTSSFPVADDTFDENGKLKTIATKFALVIGNSDTKVTGTPDFAATDAELVSSQLTNLAGYPAENIVLIKNGTSEEMMNAAKALAEKVGEEGTVLIYFSGYGANLGGHDFLAGVEASAANDQAHMVGKNDLYRLFMAKGAKIFSFFQTDRTASNGGVFGTEMPVIGAIAQMQSTTPGSGVNSRVKGGKNVGLFTDAFITALTTMRSNKIPLYEFGWQIFDSIRRSGGGTVGGGATQVPTLPTYANMGADSRF